MALFDNDLSRYRPRFVDMRIRPDKSARADAHRRCGHAGCDTVADCRVARRISRPGVTGAEAGLHDWFCKRHAALHNKHYNFFDTLSETESASFWTSERTGHRPSWTFGVGSSAHMFTQERHRRRTRTPCEPEGSPRTRLQVRSLAVLDLPADASASQVRERYAILVKIFHPDANGGDRSTEERLAKVIKAFKILKNAKMA